MGVYQSWDAWFVIPKEQDAALRAALDEQFSTWQDTTGEDDITAIMWHIAEAFGTEDHPQEAWRRYTGKPGATYTPAEALGLWTSEAEDAGDAWKITGCGYGKVGDEKALVGALAGFGVEGEVDWECEGDTGRYAIRDGNSYAYGTVLTYPMDPRSDDPLAKVITELVEDKDWSADTLDRIVGHLAPFVECDDDGNVRRK